MHNKTVIIFGFCYIQNNQGLTVVVGWRSVLLRNFNQVNHLTKFVYVTNWNAKCFSYQAG